jgi:hypothetical protein
MMSGVMTISVQSLFRWVVVLAGIAVVTYACLIAVTWKRFGHPRPPSDAEVDPVLDRYMPKYDVVDRHHVRVSAPADIVYRSACNVDIQESAIVRAIFNAREMALRSAPDEVERPRELIPWVLTIGWNILEEEPGREVVLGTVTQPWEANPEFRTISPKEFVAFDQPDFVKIAWTLRVDPVSPTESILYHETRAWATDAEARSKFRLYWSLAWPGLFIIRPVILNHIKRDAERLVRHAEAPRLERSP